MRVVAVLAGGVVGAEAVGLGAVGVAEAVGVVGVVGVVGCSDH